MPINPGQSETEEEFISRCMSEEKDSFPETGQRYAVCKSTWDKENMSFQKIVCDECGWSWDLKDGGDDPYVCHKCGKRMPLPVSEEAQQGGVVGAGFARTKFEFIPKAKEKLNDYMARCMSDSLVRERKPSRVNRAGFCYSEYQNRYIMTIGQKWS